LWHEYVFWEMIVSVIVTRICILGDDSIGHCDTDMYLSDNQDTAAGIYKYKSTVNGNK